MLPELTGLLADIVHPAGILARSDPRVRLLGGWSRLWRFCRERCQTITVREGRIDATSTLDTAREDAFLDQREPAGRGAVCQGRVLGASAMPAVLPSAASRRRLIALDISEDATALRNASRNGLSNVSVRTTNVFDELPTLERMGEKYDAIVLDPPAFAKSKAAIPKALSGYREINLRSLKLLKPGGFLITCSCSYHVNESSFAEVIFDAALDARTELSVVEKRMQGRDHPVVLGMPETYYLKCFILRKLT